MADSNKDIRDANDLLREQLELLKQVKDLHQDSYDVSTAAVDSIKEALGINSRRSTFERDTLKVNQSIAQTILDQKTGLSDMESIGRQISKNQNLLNKAKLIEAGLSSNLSKQDKQKIEDFTKLYTKQQELNQKLERGEDLTKRQINSLLKKLALNDAQLDSYTQQLNSQQLQLAYTKLNTEALKKQLELREAEKSVIEKINHELGFYPKALAGVDKMLQKMGLPELGVSDALKKTHELGQAAEVAGTEFNAMGTFTSQLKTNIAGAFSKANLLQLAITELVLALKASDDGAGDMAKKMNLTYTEALRVRGEMGTIAGVSGDAALNTKRLQESLVFINQQLGTNGKISEQDLITFTKLREQSGLTNEQLFAMQKYTLATGGTLEDNVATFQATSKILSYQNKISLNTKQLMADMGSVSNRTKLSIEGGAAGLAKAAFNAKLMGSDLEKVAAIADQLLNFESSIEAELSAELLTGKDITLEKARQAALNNDLATVATEITNQIGSAANFTNYNRIQQEAMAKAVGMTADQLADVLVEQEAISAIGGKLSDDEQRAFDAAKSQYGIAEASRRLKDGQLAQMVKQQSVQERFNQTVEKLKEIFVQIAEPVLQIVSPLMDMVSSVMPLLNVILQPLIATLRTIGSLISGINKLTFLSFDKKGAMSDLTPSNLFKGYTDLYDSSKNKALSIINDGEIDPENGPILTGGFGSVQLNPRDKAMYGADGTIKVGTDLLKENTTQINPYTNNTQTSAPSPSVDISAMVNKMEQMFAKLQDRPVVVHSVVKTENNDVLATATNTSNRKTGYSIQ